MSTNLALAEDPKPSSLPYNIEAEQGLLGMLLVDNRHFDQIGDWLLPAHFYEPAHQRIFEAISVQIHRGTIASPVTLKDYFSSDDRLEKVGGGAYLAELAAECPLLNSANDYGRTIREHYLRRCLIVLSQDAMYEAYEWDLDNDADKQLEQLEEKLFTLGENGQVNPDAANLSDCTAATLELIERVQKGEDISIKTGIGALDKMNNGFWGGQLIVIAGRPSMGKTAFAMTLAHNMAQGGNNVMFFSLEMSCEELTQRLLARYTEITTGMQLREGALERKHWDRLVKAQQKLAELPLYIDDSAGISVNQIRTRCRRHKRKHGLDVIIVDYLGLMNLPDRYQSKVDQLGEVTRALKVLAKDFGVPVILLHQLNRGPETRGEDKRPMLSDLRDSGNIEQDADAVIFLYRDEYYLEREEPKRGSKQDEEAFVRLQNNYHARLDASRGKADILIPKFRQGKTGEVRVSFSGPRQAFYDSDLEGVE